MIARELVAAYQRGINAYHHAFSCTACADTQVAVQVMPRPHSLQACFSHLALDAVAAQIACTGELVC
jgi:hypothetical protein